MLGDQVMERDIHGKGDTLRTEELTQVPTSSVNAYVAFQLSLVPEVERVYTAFRDNRVFYVWIVVGRWEREVRQRIYERQEAIIDEFTDESSEQECSFDFYIVPREGERVEDLISQSIDLAYVRPQQS
jgi:hypothetical protein